MRTFIIFHDCGHGSFFKSSRANAIVGTITGILTFTPYYQWRHDHAVHHATSGDLDRRGVGDVWMLTVDEYRAASPLKKLGYRIFRNPFFMLVLGPIAMFVIFQRFPTGTGGRRERLSVWGTDAVLLGIWAVAAITIGIKAYILIQLPVLLVAGSLGIWMFYVQHQYPGVCWERHMNWNYVEAALQGSSFYRLPRFLQWFTGNIGFHHIHHLNSRIPNYKLEKCYLANPMLHAVPVLTLRSSLAALRYRLWDEDRKMLVGYPRTSI
jgi:acyl-lipid omega-6 desaturase (Delta-12 desaturase)